VHFLERRAEARALNKFATSIVQSRCPDSPLSTGSDSAATSASILHPLRDALGLDGTGEIIAIADTGVDTSHCFFRDPTEEVPYDATISHTHRKLVNYYRFVDGSDLNGHGTHVAGSALGEDCCTPTPSPNASARPGLTTSPTFAPTAAPTATPTASPSPAPSAVPTPASSPKLTSVSPTPTPTDLYSSFGSFGSFVSSSATAAAAATITASAVPRTAAGHSGLAPKAKLAFFDIGYQDSRSLFVPPDAGVDMFPVATFAGAAIHSNSWASGTLAYTSNSQDIDSYVWEHPEMLVLFAAGNSGGRGTHRGQCALGL
jgi:hypothetical protein